MAPNSSSCSHNGYHHLRSKYNNTVHQNIASHGSYVMLETVDKSRFKVSQVP